jgi:hypothetical protein
MKDQLYCPRCLSPLIKGEGTRIYQTLVEHVSDPNGTVYPKEYFICSNNDCPTRIDDDFWEWYGDYHYSKSYAEYFFFLNCNKALNSSAREFEIKYRKKRQTIFYIPWFKLYIESSPIPDKIGLKIIGYKRKIKACNRVSIKEGWTEYISGIRMFFYSTETFNESLDKFLEDTTNKYSLKDLLDRMESPSWDKRWWRRLSVWVANKKYPNLKKLLQNIQNND